jgi:hypothetical protein
VTADTGKLRDVLDALEITGRVAAAGLDGQTATIPGAADRPHRLRERRQEVSFFQARSPEMTLPPGIDVPPLAEIGLRIAGLGSSEAHMLAHAIDWRSTCSCRFRRPRRRSGRSTSRAGADCSSSRRRGAGREPSCGERRHDVRDDRRHQQPDAAADRASVQ